MVTQPLRAHPGPGRLVPCAAEESVIPRSLLGVKSVGFAVRLGFPSRADRKRELDPESVFPFPHLVGRCLRLRCCKDSRRQQVESTGRGRGGRVPHTRDRCWDRYRPDRPSGALRPAALALDATEPLL